MNDARYKLRFQGQEYGPFTEKKIRAWIADRPIGPDDAVLDLQTAAWTPLAEWTAAHEETPDIFGNITIPSTYRRVTIAGAVLFLLWALVFASIRLWTGKWPGQGAPVHHNRVIDFVDTTTPAPR